MQNLIMFFMGCLPSSSLVPSPPGLFSVLGHVHVMSTFLVTTCQSILDRHLLLSLSVLSLSGKIVCNLQVQYRGTTYIQTVHTFRLVETSQREGSVRSIRARAKIKATAKKIKKKQTRRPDALRERQGRSIPAERFQYRTYGVHSDTFGCCLSLSLHDCTHRQSEPVLPHLAPT